MSTPKKPTAQRQQEINDLKQTMSTRHGRAFVWRILAESGLYQLSFTGNSTTYFNEGRKAIGISLMADINEFCFADYITARTENNAMMERLNEQG